MGIVRIGTRASALARWQTEEVVRLWRARDPGLRVEVVELTTAGDEWPEAPLERMEGTGFFTRTLERALLDRQIDVAVHSYKDLPVSTTAGVTVAAVPPRGPAEDALCARDGARLADLPPRARIGTSSPRRAAQLRALRRDLDCVPVRGNVPTRLELVARGELDAVVLALAGVERLGLGDRVTEVFPLGRVLPAPAQGALAVQTRAGDRALLRALVPIQHAPARRAVEAERAVLHELRGGCSVPVGAHASAVGGRIVLEAGVFAPLGDRAMRVRVEGADPARTGSDVARRLLEIGAGEILDEFERQPRLVWEGRP